MPLDLVGCLESSSQQVGGSSTFCMFAPNSSLNYCMVCFEVGGLQQKKVGLFFSLKTVLCRTFPLNYSEEPFCNRTNRFEAGENIRGFFCNLHHPSLGRAELRMACHPYPNRVKGKGGVLRSLGEGGRKPMARQNL